MVLGFWEIPEEEQPPPEMYGNDQKLTQWFEDVKAIRDEKYGSKHGDQLEEVPLMSNDIKLPDWV